MKTLTYSLQFFSPWHCGSGMGGGDDADYQPILDADGFPYVPGKTLKGLCLEASQLLHDPADTARLFGTATERDNAASTQGTARWSNAELPTATRNAVAQKPAQRTHLLDARYFVRLDDHGMAVDKSLRRGEYAIPMTLQGTVGHLADDRDVALVTECLQFVKQLGLQRSRGFGRCQFAVTAVADEAAAPAPDIPETTSYAFRCRFLAPVILNTSGATEGELDTLTYVPGSNFLGIAARRYDDYGDQAFTVFHSGKVRFGNAFPLTQDGRQALPCPASWFIPKGETLASCDRILTTPEERQRVQADKQPKQLRGDYFVPDATPALLDAHAIVKSFAIKSAYDSDLRRSEDAKMFGFTSLNAGTDWTFTVDFDPDVPVSLRRQVVASLLGHQAIGCSKTAQYGAVAIELLTQAPLRVASRPAADGRHYLYAASQLAFANEFGQPALLPPLAELGFGADAAYDLERTQLLYHAYCPWNGKRKSRDASRLVLLPGSVIVVKADRAPDADRLARGVGTYLAEGLGRILLNPDFLFCNHLAPAVSCLAPSTAETATGDVQQSLIDYLNGQVNRDQRHQRLYQKVREVIAANDFQRISASQWGAVRAFAAAATSLEKLKKDLFATSAPTKNDTGDSDYTRTIKNGRDVHDHHPGFLVHGKRRWKDSQVEKLKALLDEQKADASEFLQLLASEMAKHAKGGNR
ncbi:MAG: hypothetical protein ACI4WT_01875 [Oligosphaeraceae bacterium]